MQAISTNCFVKWSSTEDSSSNWTWSYFSWSHTCTHSPFPVFWLFSDSWLWIRIYVSSLRLLGWLHMTSKESSLPRTHFWFEKKCISLKNISTRYLTLYRYFISQIRLAWWNNKISVNYNNYLKYLLVLIWFLRCLFFQPWNIIARIFLIYVSTVRLRHLSHDFNVSRTYKLILYKLQIAANYMIVNSKLILDS